MNRFTFRIAIFLAILALPLAGAFGQENFPNLTNLGFATSWTIFAEVPGWDFNGGYNFTTGYPAYWTNASPGNELPRTPDSPRLKFEIGGSGDQTALLFKEVNWGIVSWIDVSAVAACRTWGGGSSGTVGIGVDPDGGATSWSDVTDTATITGTDIDWTPVSTGTITKPMGATTFTLVLYCTRTGSYWNCQIDDVEVATDVSFTDPPGTPSVSSESHAPNVWSHNNDPRFSFETTLATEYSYEWDNSPSTVPDQVAEGSIGSATISDVGDYDTDGEGWFHVRAGNTYGWSATAHFGPLLIDAADPTVTGVNWTPGPEGGVIVTATVNDTGGSPFDAGDIELFGDERVANDSFESALDSWTTIGSGPFEFDSTVFGPGGPVTGSSYFSSETGGIIDGAMYQEVSVLPWNVYRLSAYASVAAATGRTATLNMYWVNGVFGGAELPVATLSYSAGGSMGWEFISKDIFPSGSTATVVFRFSSGTNTGDPVAVHLDDVGLSWYPGAPDSWDPGTGAASWGPIPGLNGDTPTVKAEDGAGNETTASASSAMSGITDLVTAVERWELFE